MEKCEGSGGECLGEGGGEFVNIKNETYNSISRGFSFFLAFVCLILMQQKKELLIHDF